MGERLLHRCTGRMVLIALIVFMAGGALMFTLGPFPRLKTALDQAPFPEESISSPAQLEAFLGSLDDPQRSLYLQMQAWDVLNPVLMGFLGLTLTGWLVNRGPRVPWRARLLVVPLITPVADLAENAVITAAILAHPSATPVAAALPVVSGVKFAGLGLALLLMVLLVVGAIAMRLAARRSVASAAGSESDG